MSTDEILFETRGPLGLITLNRPAQLNALSHAMIRALDAQLRAWAGDAAVAAVAIQGAGEKAFSAGGDIRTLIENGREKAAESYAFYIDEYRLNARIKRFPKPYVALMDGVVMGGGVGVSIHGGYRVGGDRLLFAMPETGIGFVPDVGGAFFLPRLPRRIGWWLALTGARLKAGDAMFAHVIDYYVRSDATPALIDRLASADLASDPDGVVCEILAETAAPPPEAPLRAQAIELEEAFSAESLDALLSALKAGSAWAQAQAAEIEKKSPAATVMTWRMLTEGQRLDLEDALRLEYRLARDRVVSADFAEGVRAAIVDKDHAPRWSPASLDAVDRAAVDAAFADLGAEELRFD